ncbi:hypothetical protein EYD45_14490 [Hyunsoonleella flava]|uniref:DUF4738 domain-containing protein n=1 Tax=Hyunsoonleella flava TaxID=2527939 RepID=A0A4Q9FE23_9FLAO|nr:hypothetical protein [Hyunsoonleella flava]TBN00471.1 hypothetical protein EYD45_14490 [Hyunsoonleella flava]
MRYILVLLCIGLIAFYSCDGRIKKREALKKSVKTFKEAQNVSKTIAVFPEQYAEVKTDTILSNGYRVTVKNFTNMDKMVQLTEGALLDNAQQFRQIDSEITVYKNSKLIFKKVLSNAFSDKNQQKDMNIKQYLNNGISVDEMASLEENKVILITSNVVPKNAHNAFYRISIDAFGHADFKKIKHART